MEQHDRTATKVVIMGAAGRDFHNFNVVFRDDPAYRVVAFTAAQIPNIAGRTYPPELSGTLYPNGIPILPESDLEAIIAAHSVHQAVFAYSDVSHEDVMHLASRVLAAGAEFRLLGPDATMLRSSKPVVSVCAVRTGAGKSPVARAIAGWLRASGRRVAVVRHPMPYGDLIKQAVQRFAAISDLDVADCTIEEREEYEPHIVEGQVLYAGVDYKRILRQAESDADVIIWEGGNNDLPFVESNLEIVLVDPHRAGHERGYFPGEVNLLRADVIVLTKVDTADADHIAVVRRAAYDANPHALIVESRMPLTVDRPDLVRGKRILVIEDGPTVSHGGMAYGAGVLAAKHHGAAALIDPRPSAVGSLRDTFKANPHLECLLPAMGYGTEQLRDLEETIKQVDCELVLIATPIDLRRLINIGQPTARVTYSFEEASGILHGIVMKSFADSGCEVSRLNSRDPC
ncbi:MAG: cyclic 2,3-diphosphoglycerate synthase [Nitrospira sp.]|nr:cyclic 2,3-diphosphoglycerate synthase [Nitrospira sp.]